MRIVEQKCDCSIKVMPITDYPEYNTLYNPTWEDSAVFTLIYKINIDGSRELVDKHTSLHVIDNKPQREVYTIDSLNDGWYKVLSFIVPTKQYLVNELNMVDGFDDLEYQQCATVENQLKPELEIIVAGDESSPTKFSFTGRKANPSPYKSSGLYYWMQVTDINDLIEETETREVVDGYLYGTNIKVLEEDYFSYCNLYKCLISKATELFDSYQGCSGKGYSICKDSDKGCKSNVDETKIQIRDYLWMVINAIKYAIECEDYETANKLLNCISSCSGICNETSNKNKQSGCGCS